MPQIAANHKTTLAADDASKAQPASPPIDQTHLARYTFGDTSLEEEILGLFCQQAVELSEQMRGACSVPEWQFATHSLKGSARAVGAWSVAEHAATAEQCEPGSVRASQLVVAIAQEIDRATAFVAATYPAAIQGNATA